MDTITMHTPIFLSKTRNLLLCGALLIATATACSQPSGDAPEDMSPVTQDMPSDLATPDRDSDNPVDMTAAQDMLDAGDLGDSGSDLDLSDMVSLSDADMFSQEDLSDLSDMRQEDAAPDMPDMTGGEDADMDAPGPPLPGFGTITGDCQMIDTELASPQPSLFRNELDFMMDPYDMSDTMLLTPGGQALLAAGNVNANSLLSEVFAFEILARCEGATFLEGEMGIDYYNEMGKITDILVEIDGERVGVSVVRAFAFPFEDPYPEEEARRILNKKLGDILLSTQNVKPNHAWHKQILSVIAYSPQHADQIEAVYQTLDPMVKSDTILYVTATQGEDGPIYFND